MTYISKEGLQNLSKYKYVSGGYTNLDIWMNPWWEFVVSLVPMWMAPNLITFIGFLILIIGNVLYLIYDSTFTCQIPWWIFIYNATAIFTYQTLDAIDGKQARRTKSSSPLGQLVDHGLDSYSLVFLLLGACQALQVQYHIIITLMVSSFIGVYLANWSEQHLGKMLTKVGQFGVTECQFIFITIQLITGFKGQEYWQNDINSIMPPCLQKRIYPQILEQKLNMLVMGFGLSSQVIMSSYVITKTIYKAQNKRKAIQQLLPCLVILSNFLVWTQCEHFNSQPVVVIMTFGTIISTQCCKLIISHTTFTPYPLITSSHFIITLFTLLLYSYTFPIFYIFIFFVLLQTFRFLYIVQKQITVHLGIYLFSLKKRKVE